MAGGNTHALAQVNNVPVPHHAPVQDHRVPAFAQVQAAHQHPELQELLFGGGFRPAPRLQNLLFGGGFRPAPRLI